jgi:uncharacterized membrane protein YeaQ/YmgE (transglycosylase-associated protein family)
VRRRSYSLRITLFTLTAFDIERGKQREEIQIMDQMGWLAWSIVGATAGWLASKVMKTSRRQGLLMNIVVGILGAFWCGFLFQQFGATGTTGFDIWSLFVAFVGAVVLLVVIRLLTGRLKFLPKQQRTTRLW